MPSHFTHLVFAEEALRGALGEKAAEILSAHGNLFRFAAQGPDFFYHNQRTMPTGLRYGVALHRHGYGSFVAELVREALRLGAGPGSDLAAFILGFVTHAPLDRTAHPFIGYFAGWVDPRQEASRRLYHAHPFLERILDVLVLKERFGIPASQFDFLNKIRCGKALPYPVIKAMVKGLNVVYPAFGFKSRNRQRVENAYHDAMFFYKLTNHLNPDLIRLAYRKDRKEGFREKRLGLLHPREIPAGFDFLNLSHQEWCHPCDAAAVTRASFLELYDAALARCVPVLEGVYRSLTGQAPAEGLARLVGEESLDTGRENCTPVHSRPLPLREIMDEIYARMEAEVGSAEATPPAEDPASPAGRSSEAST
ncbi:MAG TPA: zinc dependent phospholipase C family protein [Spirochaetia bacterium]|nr:zinc dependent phospholipase C family protein [Spirochaetia bacterium]